MLRFRRRGKTEQIWASSLLVRTYLFCFFHIGWTSDASCPSVTGKRMRRLNSNPVMCSSVLIASKNPAWKIFHTGEKCLNTYPAAA